MTIDRQNYEEYFMQYADGELDERQRRSVEAFVLLHPDLAPELELFRELKIEPDEQIVFSGKAGLYRKEDNKRKLPVIRWWYAAAALVLLAGIPLAAYYLLPGKPPTTAGLTPAVGKPDTAIVAAAGKKEHMADNRLKETQEKTAPRPETAGTRQPLSIPGNTVKKKMQQPAVEEYAAGKDPVREALPPAALTNPDPGPASVAISLHTAALPGSDIAIRTPLPDKEMNTGRVANDPYARTALVTDNEAPAATGYIATKKRAIKSFLHKASHIIDQAADLRKAEQLNIRVGSIEVAIH